MNVVERKEKGRSRTNEKPAVECAMSLLRYCLFHELEVENGLDQANGGRMGTVTVQDDYS
jgi:hypothetical protein